jgi:hypothetical protein
MMRIELTMLFALIAVCTSPISAQGKFPVAEVDQILTNPNQYNGTILALLGSRVLSLWHREHSPLSMPN